jgi:hypothetical protein
MDSYFLLKAGLYPLWESLPRSFTNTMKSPNDLLHWMRDVKYGWIDGGVKRTDFKKDFSDKYRLIQPIEVYEKRIGVCQDQALFEYEVLT